MSEVLQAYFKIFFTPSDIFWIAIRARGDSEEISTGGDLLFCPMIQWGEHDDWNHLMRAKPEYPAATILDLLSVHWRLGQNCFALLHYAAYGLCKFVNS